MNEPRKAGRPRKHLEEEHHYKPAEGTITLTENLRETAERGEIILRTSDDAAAAGAPPAVADSGQADASDAELPDSSASAEIPHEAVVENPTPSVSAISIESPVEEKIHVMVEQQRVFLGEPQTVEVSQLNGWHPIETDIVVMSPPRNGMAVRVSETPEGEGVLVFWKRLRAFANATKRWQETGFWYDFHNGMKINFEPKYWKERF